MTTNNTINANSTTPLAKVNGGTGVNAVTTAPAATQFAGWDANSNLSTNALIEAFATTATAAGTTTLTVASKQIQEFTGSTTQTVVMPVTSTLVAGMSFDIINNSSGSVTINSSGGNAILVMAANTSATLVCVLNSGTAAASWNASYFFDNGAGVLSITGTANQVVASASTGAVTLSLPQDIATTSTPAFANTRSAYSAITSAAGTTTLTVSSNYFQQVTGSTTQTIQMPVTSTLITGQSWQIINNSTGVVTVNSSGSNLIISLAANTAAIVTCILTTGTTAASWTTSFSTSGGGSGIIDAWVQYTPTLTGFGTATSVNIWSRRVGGNLEVRGSFTTGTVTAVEARTTLGYQGTNANVTMSSTVINSQNQVIGTVVQGAAGASSVYNCGIASSGYFTYGVQNGTRTGLTNAVASDVFNSTSAITFMLSVPITGWS